MSLDPIRVSTDLAVYVGNQGHLIVAQADDPRVMAPPCQWKFHVVIDPNDAMKLIESIALLAKYAEAKQQALEAVCEASYRAAQAAGSAP